jgi:hypothetical protein
MKINKLIILYIILFLLLPYSFSSSQGFENHGAFISTSGKTFINVNKFNLKNTSGEFKLKYGSILTASNNIFNGGIFNTYDSSVVSVDTNFINSLNVTITGTSLLIVKKSIINSGPIFNGHIIEIGQ